MKLLDKPFENAEKESVLRMLDGCICRICVSDEPEEIIRMLGFATDYLSQLAYSRMKQVNMEKREQG